MGRLPVPSLGLVLAVVVLGIVAVIDNGRTVGAGSVVGITAPRRIGTGTAWPSNPDGPAQQEVPIRDVDRQVAEAPVGKDSAGQAD